MNEGIIILLFASVLMASACNPMNDSPNYEKLNSEKLEMTKELCEASNGYWNECGSPCAGTDAEVCIQVCSEQCECNGDGKYKCPLGFECRLSGSINDEMGVCI